MSKFTDSGDFASTSFDKSGKGRKPSITETETSFGTVVDVLTGNDENFGGVGDITLRIRNDQNRLLLTTASPMNPHQFTVPLPNELVHCIKDPIEGEWYYTGIASEKGLLNHLLNGHSITTLPDKDVPYSGKYFKSMPRMVRSLDMYEGDTVLQGRFGQSIRLTGSNPNLPELPWKSSTDSASPIITLRNGYLPRESFNTDASAIWLTSDQMFEIPLVSELPTDLQNNRDNFGSGQIVLFSERLVFGTRTDSIILSSASTIALCTPNWQHDVDVVLDALIDLIEQVDKITTEMQNTSRASATQTFPVPIVGSTLLSVQSPTFTTALQNTINIQQSVKQIKSNIEALKQK
tara:strand:- start:12394 stop:13440 length:1047 start_codon:yes stop_codon:yes gene_type:complete